MVVELVLVLNIVVEIANRYDEVVSIGRLTACYVVFVPLEHFPSEPPHSTYVIVLFLYFYKELRGVANISSASPLCRRVKP